VLPFDQAADALPTSGFKPVFARDPIGAYRYSGASEITSRSAPS
jgi:hypothetical protein